MPKPGTRSEIFSNQAQDSLKKIKGDNGNNANKGQEGVGVPVICVIYRHRFNLLNCGAVAGNGLRKKPVGGRRLLLKAHALDGAGLSCGRGDQYIIII